MRQTFSGGLSGELSGNSSTASKLKLLKTRRKRFYGSIKAITLKASHVGAFALGKTGSTVANDKAVGWNWSSGGDNDTGIKQGGNVNYSFFIWENWNLSCSPVSANFKSAVYIHRSARDGYGF
ncbi:hypothetical protein HPE45_02880 [Escherichia coli]|nr:hypothetical protein [Escherichia coli]